jgi:hypothetical protein
VTPILFCPQTIIIFRESACWAANIPDWNVQGVPLPFREFVCALQVMEHLRRLHPGARIIFEEEPR